MTKSKIIASTAIATVMAAGAAQAEIAFQAVWLVGSLQMTL